MVLRAAGDGAFPGPVMSMMEGPNGSLEFITTGSGLSATVFAHGLAGSIQTMRPFGAGVAGSRTFFHFRGHGASTAPQTPWNYAALAGELRAVADHVGATGGAVSVTGSRGPRGYFGDGLLNSTSSPPGSSWARTERFLGHQAASRSRNFAATVVF